MRSIGIRELRQNASKFVRDVELGETIQVTDRGRPVALLTPLPQTSRMQQLLATGRLRPGNSSDVISARKRVEPKPGVPLPSVILSELREGER